MGLVTQAALMVDNYLGIQRSLVGSGYHPIGQLVWILRLGTKGPWLTYPHPIPVLERFQVDNYWNPCRPIITGSIFFCLVEICWKNMGNMPEVFYPSIEGGCSLREERRSLVSDHAKNYAKSCLCGHAY